MRSDILLALLLAVGPLFGAVAMMSAPILFPKLPRPIHLMLFWGGIVGAVVSYAAAFGIAMNVTMSAQRALSLAGLFVFGALALVCLWLFLKAPAQAVPGHSGPPHGVVPPPPAPKVATEPKPTVETRMPPATAHAHGEASVATEVIKAPTQEPTPDATAEREQEMARRAALLRQLTQLYMFSHDGITPRMMAGLELPPADFLNEELEKQGAQWRVRAVNGPNAETYELP